MCSRKVWTRLKWQTSCCQWLWLAPDTCVGSENQSSGEWPVPELELTPALWVRCPKGSRRGKKTTCSSRIREEAVRKRYHQPEFGQPPRCLTRSNCRFKRFALQLRKKRSKKSVWTQRWLFNQARPANRTTHQDRAVHQIHFATEFDAP